MVISIGEAVQKIRSGEIDPDEVIRIKKDRGMLSQEKRQRIAELIPGSESWSYDEFFRTFFWELRTIESERAKEAACM